MNAFYVNYIKFRLLLMNRANKLFFILFFFIKNLVVSSKTHDINVEDQDSITQSLIH